MLCYGGWVRIRLLPLHLWNLKIFKAIGRLGGFIDYTRANSLLIDCVEGRIKIRENYCGFILAEIKIEEDEPYNIQVVTFQEGKQLVDRLTRIHGSFLPSTIHAFHRGPCDSSFTDKWRIEDGFRYPTINTQKVMESIKDSDKALEKSTENFNLAK